MAGPRCPATGDGYADWGQGTSSGSSRCFDPWVTEFTALRPSIPRRRSAVSYFHGWSSRSSFTSKGSPLLSCTRWSGDSPNQSSNGTSESTSKGYVDVGSDVPLNPASASHQGRPLA